MIEHLNNFKGLINQLEKIEMKLNDALQALLLLSSLPESWDTLVVTLSDSTRAGKLTMDIVIDSLLNEEARGKERGISLQYEANFVDNHGRSKNCRRNKGCDKSGEGSQSRPKLVCYCCGKPGHKKSNCGYYKRHQKAEKFKPDQIKHKKEDKTVTAIAAKMTMMYS